MGLMTTLRTLDAHSNQLTGLIPAAVGNMTALTSLQLHINNFTGAESGMCSITPTSCSIFVNPEWDCALTPACLNTHICVPPLASCAPTSAPAAPTVAPSASPTAAPSTAAPSANPSAAPSTSPTQSPTQVPTQAPTAPTVAPSASPTAPTMAPAQEPTRLSIAQPSYRLICVLQDGDDPSSNALALCGETLTTHGNESIVIIGGNCAECAQPPFYDETSVAIGGVVVESATIAGGSRIVTRTPSIAELGAVAKSCPPSSIVEQCFDYGSYYDLTIATPFGAHGLNPGAVEVGPNALRSVSNQDELACARSAHCPDIAPALSGIYYSELCLGFLDANKDARWNVTSSAPLFAYGFRPNCRACPKGCRCPGGTRCHVEPGFFLPVGVEQLPADGAYNDGPLVCHFGTLRCDSSLRVSSPHSASAFVLR